MFYALIWFLVLALLALWSLTAWALQAATVWAVSNTGALTGAVANAGAVLLPDWFAPWIPPELVQWMGQVLATVGPLVEGLLQAMPALAGGVTAVAWIVWGIGSALLVLLGGGLHVLIGVWRRRGPGTSGSGPASRLSAGGA